MTIDLDVRAVAKDFGLDPALLQSVVNAEGNILKAVQMSIPSIQTRLDALRVTARSAVHAMCDWVKSGGPNRQEDFVGFWAGRWAPIGVANDPHNQNANWPRNVFNGWTSTNV